MHIADVSYFVEPESALDLVASQRATSVYLVQKVCYCAFVSSGCPIWYQLLIHLQVIPMLPRTLCEHLCSLNSNEVHACG